MVLAVMTAGIVLVYIPSTTADKVAIYMDRKSAMALWLVFCYAVYAIWAFFIEKFYVEHYSEHLRYKDISLEFASLDPSLRSEAEIFAKFYKFSCGKVKEISLIYNLADYFKLKNELKSIEERKDDAKRNWLLQKKREELETFQTNFKSHPEKYFTGRGFVTFQNYKYAELFKLMYHQAYRRSFLNLFSRSSNKSARQKFQSAIHTVIKDKRQEGKERAEGAIKDKQQSTIQPPTQPPTIIKTSPESESILSSLWKFMFENKLTAEQKRNLALMKPTFGEGFKLRRTIDPELINFNFSGKAEISRLHNIFYFIVLFIVLPAIAYLLSFSVAKHQLLASIESHESAIETFHRIVLAIMISLLDQVGYLLIEVFFYQTRFIKASQMFHYLLSYYSFFNLIAVIIVPNLAFKQAFNEVKPLISSLSAAALNKKYSSVILTNYFKLIFSALNFKLIKPILVNKLIFKRHKRVAVSSNIIFGISFLITSTFYVAFFGTINPAVFFLFALALVCLYFWDSRNFRRIKIESGRIKNPREPKVVNDDATGLPILKRYDMAKLPVTIFTTALNILVIGTFIVSCFGYYGIGVEIDQAQKSKHGILTKIKNFFLQKNKSGDIKPKSSISSFISQLWSKETFEKAQSIDIRPDVFMIFWKIMVQLLTDVRFLMTLAVYFVHSVFYV
jgi:hypothetical protein